MMKSFLILFSALLHSISISAASVLGRDTNQSGVAPTTEVSTTLRPFSGDVSDGAS
jgi:hypothetical protein